ncbi:MAG: TonB-dependent receptor [Roseateles asaccharophilus]|uniref:Iron complex outermembrane receptor protein n=1 Tax=Roseateles asaccharophilus TaxID=582607 RepID=A0A4R6N313_9BURK|nr:TonB-dependent receptor [Roseateles asaccharophilus]MDN3544212.1 TonB-dependent receptor [Roseateles asaccharophilus]TDP09196.1 iron complex outermembrane receptor protein [Roseateles asaccharophilus]
MRSKSKPLSRFAPKRLMLALPALLAGLPTAALAQAAPLSTRQLERVTVDAASAAAPLEASAGSSSRLGLSLKETPASVTVVERNAIEARGAANTQDILKGVPGVSFADPPGSAGSVSYRGFGAGSLAQLYNGISVQYDAIAARPVDSWIVDRVEAIGGPSSFLNGSGAVGGTLNTITKIADTSGDISRFLVGLGDRAQLATSLQRSLGDSGQVLRLELNRSEGALWTQGRDRSAWQVAASWRAPLTAGLVHTLALERQHEKVTQPYWGTPMLRSADGNVPNGQLEFDRGTYGVNYNVVDGRYEQDVTWARSILEWQLEPATRLTHTLYHYDALRDYDNLETYTFRNNNSRVERSNVLLQRHDQQVWGSRAELSHGRRIAGLRSDFVFGWDWSFNKQTRFPLSLRVPFGLVDPYAPVVGQFLQLPGVSKSYTPGATNLLRSFALFAENRTELGAGWSVVSALRADRIALDVRNHRTVSDTNPPMFPTDFTPLTGRLGLVKDLSKDWQVYAQASTAADPPSGVLATAGFSALRDFDLTKGRQFELGSKFGFDAGRGAATVAVYDITRKNLSITDPTDVSRVIPVGEQGSRGLELAAQWRPTAAWEVAGHWSYTRARYKKFVETARETTVSRAGNTPANVPAVVAGLSADWKANDALTLGADWRHVGKRYANTANTIWDRAYQLVGLSATLRITPQITARARIDNLGDERYVASLSDTLPYLGAPRSISGSLDWQF